MSVQDIWPHKLRLGILAAVLLTFACLAGVFAGTASADASDWFCPVGGVSTISLGPNQGCTNSYFNKLTEVAFYHASGSNVDHCAVSKATSDPDGQSSNVIPAVCNHGSGAYGYVTTAYVSGGAWSYARGKNNENVTHYDFYGYRWWVQ